MSAKLPLISVARLRSGNDDLIRECSFEIGEAASNFGFFRISDHGIALSSVENTYQIAERFFSLPENIKRKYYIGRSSNHRGYVPFSEKGDYPDEKNRSYEAFDLGLDLPDDDPDYLSGNRILGPNVWPDVPDFKNIVSHYYTEISKLGRLVARSLEIYLGLPDDTITSKMSKPISQLRLLHYVRQPEIMDHNSVNMGAHTDYECLTLLHTRNDGLQVMTQDDVWIDVPADPNVFVVNIGDMMEAWSNGILRSTPHRVLNLRPERFSLPYFVAANYNTVIAPFEELVTPERPAKYQPFVAGEHLERMLIRDFPYLKDASRKRISSSQQSWDHEISNPFENRLATDSI